jgi:hypothetical protein
VYPILHVEHGDVGRILGPQRGNHGSGLVQLPGIHFEIGQQHAGFEAHLRVVEMRKDTLQIGARPLSIAGFAFTDPQQKLEAP